ncbi:MAG: hypothetical protein H6P96_495 [Candidatus Aminicenantes bacterium]|jgi:hypothetical protein|nr:hypothetical protein [Candidatus Aminicenantes bacterium]
MYFLGIADPGLVPPDALTGIAYGIIKVLAYGALAVAAAGIVMTCLCDLFECRTLRRSQGRTEAWRLMH